jgi:hypothetical protein
MRCAYETKKWLVGFKVRPAPGHPLYDDAGWGILYGVIWAPSGLDAIKRATAIVNLLYFEIVGETIWDEFNLDYYLKTDVWKDWREEHARHVGLQFSLSWVAKDDTSFDFVEKLQWGNCGQSVPPPQNESPGGESTGAA